MVNRSILVTTLTVILLSLVGKAQAEWSAAFQAPTASNPALLIDLPDELDIMTLTSLTVELDGIDITALLSLSGNDFSYLPVQALASGEHLVRLVILNPDGSATEKDKWVFTTENSSTQSEQEVATAWLRSTSFSADTLTEFSNRTRQRNIGTAPDHSIVSGGGNINGRIQGQNWTLDARTNYLIQSDKDLALTGNVADIGEYSITADLTGNGIKSGMTLGHHDIGVNSLLMSSFHRRGLSARVATENDRLSTDIFAFRPESQVGASDFTGLSDSDNRLQGVSATVKPFSADRGALQLTGLYYDGEGETSGIGINGDVDSATGSGWGLILEKTFAQGKVDLRGEYARSHYDADGDNQLLSKDKSDALLLAIEARPFDNPNLFGRSADIVFGAKYERMDTFFESLANQGLAADRDAMTTYSNFYWGSFSGNLQLVHETNNVDDLAGAPTDLLKNVLWNGHYTFDKQTGSSAWLGSPYVSLSGYTATLDRDDTPEAYQGNDTDNTSRAVTLSGGSSYQQWYWSGSYSFASLEDKADVTSDTTSHFSSLGAGWTVSDRLSLNGDLQYGIFEDRDNDDNGYNTNINFGIRSVLIQDKLDLNVNYNLNLFGGSNDLPDKHILNSELGWTIRPARPNYPGFSLAVRGSMETTDGNTNNVADETQYQIFAIFRITAPLSNAR